MPKWENLTMLIHLPSPWTSSSGEGVAAVLILQFLFGRLYTGNLDLNVNCSKQNSYEEEYKSITLILVSQVTKQSSKTLEDRKVFVYHQIPDTAS